MSVCFLQVEGMIAIYGRSYFFTKIFIRIMMDLIKMLIFKVLQNAAVVEPVTLDQSDI